MRTLVLILVSISPVLATNIPIGTDASNYGVLFEGGGTGKNVSLTNVTVNGNIGVGGSGGVAFTGPGTINGRVDFSDGSAGQYSNSNGSNVGPSSVNYGVAGVTSALNTLNSLNAELGALVGKNQGINVVGSGKMNLFESNGNLLTSGGVTYRVFNVTSLNVASTGTVQIAGDGSGNPVVFNFVGTSASTFNFNGQIILSGGLTDDQVLWNFVGGSGLSGGPSVSINNGASGHASTVGAHGIFLDPNGTMTVTNSNIFGRIFGGDSQNMQVVSGSTLTAPAAFAHNPEPSAIVLLATILLGATLLVRRKQVSGRSNS